MRLKGALGILATLAIPACGDRASPASVTSAASSASALAALPSAGDAMAAARRAESPAPVPTLPTKGMPPVVVERQAKCDAGDGLACVDLAFLVVALGVTRQPERLAAEIVRVACERGSTPACAELGARRILGRGLPQDTEAAARELEGACEKGEPEGCGALGLELVYGKRVAHDPKRGLALLVRACDGGSFRACEALERRPWVARYTVEKRDPDEPRAKSSATDVTRRACLAGRLLACDRLNNFNDVKGEDAALCKAGVFLACAAAAERAIARACAAGDVRACRPFSDTELAPACALGFGGGCTYETAVPDLERGCKAGATEACNQLLRRARVGPASVCAMGDDVACATAEAAKNDAPMTDTRRALLAKGCPEVEVTDEARLSRSACRTLGVAYRDGAGVDKDAGKALEYLRRACWGNGRFADDEACVAFGDIVRDGNGVRADRARALLSYLSACWASEGQPTVSCDRAKALMGEHP